MEASGLEVTIVGKGVVDGEAAHDEEGEVVDETGIACVSPHVVLPSLAPLRGSGGG
jgi:hypothetical protein